MIENYNSVAHLVECAKKENKKISQLVMEQQAVFMELSEEEIFNFMEESYQVMEESIKGGLAKDLKSASGLTGGDAYKMKEYIKKGNTLTGDIMANSLMAAIAVSEFNASMGKIVASPTAGSCGILPSVLSVVGKARNIYRKDIIKSLFTASGIGMVIANNASLAGAEGGCQAECGSAAAMAAAAAVELCGGTPDMVSYSVGIALQNIMGLVCDPVAGLVEVPCIKRNASGAANALISAEIALAGIENVIPTDEIIFAMKEVGDAMHPSLKETAQGGIAATKTGKKLFSEIFGSDCGPCKKCRR